MEIRAYGAIAIAVVASSASISIPPDASVSSTRAIGYARIVASGEEYAWARERPQQVKPCQH